MRTQSNWNSHVLLLEMQNNTATMENILEFSYKVTHTLTLWSSNLIPRLPKRNKNTCLHRDLYESIYKIFIDNHQTSENKTNVHQLMRR